MTLEQRIWKAFNCVQVGQAYFSLILCLFLYQYSIMLSMGCIYDSIDDSRIYQLIYLIMVFDKFWPYLSLYCVRMIPQHFHGLLSVLDWICKGLVQVWADVCPSMGFWDCSKPVSPLFGKMPRLAPCRPRRTLFITLH